MLQIISGQFAHRRLEQPPAHITRPVSEKARGAVFNMLADRVVDAEVLDLFAGSGALGLEALSRGAARVAFVEKNTKVAAVVRRNIAMLGVEAATGLTVVPVERFLKDATTQYDIILIDPPYVDFSPALVEQAMDLLQYDGVMVVSTSSKVEVGIPAGLELVQQKVYGDSMITVFLKIDSA